LIERESFETTPEGTRLYAVEWLPEFTPTGTIVLVHGLGEHAGRYRHVAEFLSRAGYAIQSFDQRGHGKSPGARGHIPSYEAAMDDIQFFIQLALQKHPGLPLFLYGHSLGGSMVLYYGFTRPTGLLTGIISTSPGLAPAVPPSAATMLAGKVMSKIAPSFALKNGLDLSGISHDPSVQIAYVQDPLVHPTVSAALGMEILNNGQWMLNQKREYPLPLLLFQGTADRLVNPQATIQFAQQISGNVVFKAWEGGYHELHNEPEREVVLQSIADWMKQTINKVH
jgi:alpha-beta hydrolase superfamily lysophospholipase